MFKAVHVAEFEVDGNKARFEVECGMSVPGVQVVLQKLMHFCVERQKEAENEETQRKLDEEQSKPPVLETESALEAEERSKANEEITEETDSV